LAKITFTFIYAAFYLVSFKIKAEKKHLPELLCHSPTPQTICLHIGSIQKYLPPYHRWPASERVHSNAPRQPAKAQNGVTDFHKHRWLSAEREHS